MSNQTMLLAFLVLVSTLPACNQAEAERRARQAREDAERETKKRVEDTRQFSKGALSWVDAAKNVKAELDKVFPSKTEYELIFDAPEEGANKLKAHEARLAKMDRVEVQGITVGYEERKDRSLGGKSFERHFRATWVLDGKVIAVSYYSKEGINAVAFQELLKTLVPATNDVFKHVQLKRGE